MHRLRVIGDDQLPEEYEWALVEDTTTGRELFLIKHRAVGNPQVFAEMWAAYRKMDRAHTPCRQGPPCDGDVIPLSLVKVS